MRVARGVSKNICVIYVFLETNTHTHTHWVELLWVVNTFPHIAVVCRRRAGHEELLRVVFVKSFGRWQL